MTLKHVNTIEAVKAFLVGNQDVIFAVADNKEQRYKQIAQILARFSYHTLKRADKGYLIRFLQKISGYSRQQLTRLICQHKSTGRLTVHQCTSNGFKKRYTDADIRCLAELDRRHDTPNGYRVKKLCERAFMHFNEPAYERLVGISISHIYNIRKTSCYKSSRQYFTKTKGKKGVDIGKRKKPRPEGKPGYLRIDTVHQGDQDGKKGVYHINAVDEVTQFEMVVSVEKISEAYLLPALELLLAAFPFIVFNFHSDNGSEYINKCVAKLLNKLPVEMTKSRPRTSTDNALAEGKNACVVRKTFGYAHIPQRFAQRINEFNIHALNPYVNYHRPCLFPKSIINAKGKEIKKYAYDDVMTPYEKLKSLPNAYQYLKQGITFDILDDISMEKSDNEAADFLNAERNRLFQHINEECLKSAV